MKVFVDTNIFFPISLADLVLSSAEYGLFDLCWSKNLLDEIERVLVQNKGLEPIKAALFIQEIASTFSGGEIKKADYSNVGGQLSGPDPDDLVHLAAAIAGNVDTVMTSNVRDFSTAVLPAGLCGPDIKRPDDFFCQLIAEGLHDDLVEITMGMAKRCKNPPMTWHEILARLSKVGLPCLASELLRVREG
jgi:predicted nucleic acid-binding protein